LIYIIEPILYSRLCGRIRNHPDLTPFVSHRTSDFSSGVSFFEIAESFRDLAQRVLFIYDWWYLTTLKQLSPSYTCIIPARWY